MQGYTSEKAPTAGFGSRQTKEGQVTKGKPQITLVDMQMCGEVVRTALCRSSAHHPDNVKLLALQALRLTVGATRPPAGREAHSKTMRDTLNADGTICFTMF